MLNISKVLFIVLLLILLVDTMLLYSVKKGLHLVRTCPDKLSNGDLNPVRIYLENKYSHTINCEVIDEVPIQFQKRDNKFLVSLNAKANKIIDYELRPVKRGSYAFGAVNVLTSTLMGLVTRRFRFSLEKEVPVYPSFIQMHKYELMAISNKLIHFGIKKIRRIGHNMEFEQIKEYVIGDDFRTINWKATARKNTLMVNNYQDEKSQQVYCIIDKGRVMKMPFEEMTLMDYAINASLVISNIAIKKEDKAGLISFHNRISLMLPASKRNAQMRLISEALYNQKTNYKESNFEALFSEVKRKISQRSLLLLFTNFESVSGLRRQLPYLQKINKNHLLVVTFFENTELDQLLDQPADSIEKIYDTTIAQQFVFEKKLIVKELNSHGIYTILTSPKKLTVNTINKYLELKARGYI